MPVPEVAAGEARALRLRLEPEDNERLSNLCGQLDEHLRQIERRLGGEINSRGHDFTILGNPADVATAADYNAKGFDFICYSGDVWVFQAGLKAGVDGIREACAKA